MTVKNIRIGTPSPVPHVEAGDTQRYLAPYISCLETFGLTRDEVWEELFDASSARAALEMRFFLRQMEMAQNGLGGKKALGLIIHEYSGPMFNQMQTSWAHRLRGDARFQLFIIITDPHLRPPEDGLDSAFKDLPWIWAPHEEQLAQLCFVDAFIALDFASAKLRRLPRRSFRFLQPHGTDILARYSYMFYGAGLMFDHLLCPSFSPDIVPDDLGVLLGDIFPEALIDHAASTLTLIPFGNIKLDRFIERCVDAQPVDIIYNFSYWELEGETARANAVKTVSRLLDAFPGRRVIFRPFPGDEKRHCEIQKTFSDHPRFMFSTGSSYIEDYRNGAVLIYHRGSSAEIFSMATCQPAIKFTEQPTPSSPRETDIGFEVYRIEQLIGLVGRVLQTPRACSRRLKQLRRRKYPAAGRSLTIFLEQLHELLTTGRRPDAWRELQLHTPISSSGKKAVDDAVAKALGQGDLIPMLGTAAADAYPEEPVFHLYAAWSVFVHIYPSEITPNPWLIGAEYLSAFFRKAGDQWPRIVAEAGAGDWLAEQLPAKLLGLWSHSITEFNAQELKRLQGAIAGLPLDPFDPASISRKVQERLSLNVRAARSHNRLRWQLARQLEKAGAWQRALALVNEAPLTTFEDGLLKCRLLFRNGHGLQALHRAMALLGSQDSGELVCLLLQILGELEPEKDIIGSAVSIVQKAPDDRDCLAYAVNLARTWKHPRLIAVVRERLSKISFAEAAGWGELLPNGRPDLWMDRI